MSQQTAAQLELQPIAQRLTQHITGAITELLGATTSASTVIIVERPADPTHGHFATNCALALFGKLRAEDKKKLQLNSPRALAEAIVKQLKKANSEFLASITVAGPGFINFTITSQYL